MILLILSVGSMCVAGQNMHFLFKTINHTQGLTSVAPLATMQDSRGLVWIIAYDGVYTYDGFRATRKEVRNCDTCNPSGDFVYGLLELPKGKYWMLTSKGIGTFNPLEGLFTLVKAIPNILWCNNMVIANDSSIRIKGCSDQPLLFNIYNRTIFREKDVFLEGFWDLLTPAMGLEDYFRQYPAMRAYTLNGTLSRSWFWKKDKEGKIWCTDGAGLHLFLPGKNRYESLGKQYPIFSGGNITSIRLDSKGILWITIQGVGVVMLQTKEAVFNALTSKSKPISLVKDFVIGIYPLGKEEVAIYPQFSRPEMATILNTKDMTARIRKGDKALMDRIMAMQYASVNGGDAITMSGFPISREIKAKGINFFWGKKGIHYVVAAPGLTLTTTHNQKELLKGFSHITLKYLGDTLWFGTESHGLVAIDLNTSAASAHYPTAVEGGGFDSWTVFGIVPDVHDYLWLATSRGLWHFNKKNRTFIGYHTKDGLPNAYVYCITKDIFGKLWLGTGNGLSCFDPQTKSFRNYFPADGLVNIEYNRNSAYTATDGRVFMGGGNGVDYFYPDEIKTENMTASPYFSAVYHHDQQLDAGKNATLKSGQNSLTFLLGVDEPFMADKYRLQWRLDGSGEDWANAGSSRTLNLANLTANDYTLRVRMLDPNGTFVSKEAVYSFSIAPYWYDTWFMRILFVLLATGILSSLIFYRQRQKIARLQQENEIMRLKAEQEAILQTERERITADLHDDAGATLSSMYLYGDLAHRLVHTNAEKTAEMLERIMHASEDLMQRLNDIIWSLKSANDQHNALHLRLKNYSQELFGSQPVKVFFDVDEDIDALMHHPAARKNLLLIAREALNNAAKHSKASELAVSLKITETGVMLSVRDNGKGMEAKAGRGNGLGNMQARAKNLGGTLEILSEPGSGTTIICRVPVTYN